jgi:hypothetical protein
MNRFLKTAILSVAVTATTLASLPSANAGERWRHNRHYRHSGDGDLAVAGLLGLAAGALVIGLAAQPTYREPIYVNPRPRPQRPYADPYGSGRDVVYLDDGYAAALEPWSPEWYDYCADRYRSFDERTGTFRGYDGQDHFCVAN